MDRSGTRSAEVGATGALAHPDVLDAAVVEVEHRGPRVVGPADEGTDLVGVGRHEEEVLDLVVHPGGLGDRDRLEGDRDIGGDRDTHGHTE